MSLTHVRPSHYTSQHGHATILSRAQVRPPPQHSRTKSIDCLLALVFTQGSVDAFIGSTWIRKREREPVGVREGVGPIDLDASASPSPLLLQYKGSISVRPSFVSPTLPASKQPLTNPFATWRCDVSVISANTIRMMEQFVLQIAVPSDGRAR